LPALADEALALKKRIDAIKDEAIRRRLKWDHEFESAFLQQPVCLTRISWGCRRKAPHFGGGLRLAGDVRRDAHAANRDSFAVSL